MWSPRAFLVGEKVVAIGAPPNRNTKKSFVFRKKIFGEMRP